MSPSLENDRDAGVQVIVGGKGVTAWRWLTAFLGIIAAFAGSYAVLWMRANAPTRDEFKELSTCVKQVELQLKGMPNYDRDLLLLDKRVSRLEEWRESRFPTKP